MIAPYSVALVHYHLRPGGVTRVIEATAAGLDSAGIPHLILSGEAPSQPHPRPVHVIDGLGYQEAAPSTDGAQLAQALLLAATTALGDGPIVWHFHNHSLGRNPALASAVAILAESGAAMILQCHDFAEDGRPQNHAAIAKHTKLYPHSPRVRLAFLNARDQQYFLTAGLPRAHASLLPNPIVRPSLLPQNPSSTDSALVLYPTRGIRRKNLGELFLLAALSPVGTRYATTLAPVDSRWKTIYDAWIAFAHKSRLPVLLGVVDRLAARPGLASDYTTWLHHSTHCLTTSVSEGFGLAFLEPVSIGKPLLGRNLPAVTTDFAKAGILPGRLYDRLLIPISWIGIDTLRENLARSLRDTLESYGQSMTETRLDQTLESLIHGDHLDFGNLPEDLQRQVIRRALDPSQREAILAETPDAILPLAHWLARHLAERSPTTRPELLAPYSPEAHTRRLRDIHRDLLAAPPSPPDYLPPSAVLTQFLHPASFHFLMT
ncbi:MAG: hypothetical protein EAZ71_13790 [Verrucomicrobia bacterium]|nr:MAG: hypothetical protein EAZ71_13790 [Verrucomicrobiota bacterium]